MAHNTANIMTSPNRDLTVTLRSQSVLPPTDSLPVPSYHVLDPLGELTIEVGANATRFQVCHRALSRASPIFRCMLGGHFKEARPDDGEPWVVSLPDEKPSAMLLLMSIVHCNFDNVPSAMLSYSLYDLLILTNKYQMTHVLKPWAHTWFGSGFGLFGASDALGLAMSYELGSYTCFCRYFDSLCRNLNGDGTFFASSNEIHFSPILLPHDITAVIKAAREKMLQRLFCSLTSTLNVIRTNVASDQRGTKYAAYFGKIVATLSSKELSVVFSTDPNAYTNYAGSVESLLRCLGEMKQLDRKVAEYGFDTLVTEVDNTTVKAYEEILNKKGKMTGLK